MKKTVGRIGAITLAATMMMGGFEVAASEVDKGQGVLPIRTLATRAIPTATLTEAQQADLMELHEARVNLQSELAQKYQEFGIKEGVIEREGLAVRGGFGLEEHIAVRRVVDSEEGIELGKASIFAKRIEGGETSKGVRVMMDEQHEELRAAMQQMRADIQEKIDNLSDEQKAELDELSQQIAELNIAILAKAYEFGMITEEAYTIRMGHLEDAKENNQGGMFFRSALTQKS